MVRVGSVKPCRAVSSSNGRRFGAFGVGAPKLSRIELAQATARAINAKAKFIEPKEKSVRPVKSSANDIKRNRVGRRQLVEKARVTPFGKDPSDVLIKDALSGAGRDAQDRNAFYYAATDLLIANPAKYPGVKAALVRRRVLALADTGVLGPKLQSAGKSVK